MIDVAGAEASLRARTTILALSPTPPVTIPTRAAAVIALTDSALSDSRAGACRPGNGRLETRMRRFAGRLVRVRPERLGGVYRRSVFRYSRHGPTASRYCHAIASAIWRRW